MAKPAQAPDCPCGGGKYAQCCGRYHAGSAAPTPLALMRSRYSAYVLDLGAYLQATWHPSTRPSEAITAEPDLKWLGLEIRRHHTDGDNATVEFIARYKVGGRAHRLHELSQFVREGELEGSTGSRWFYVDGSFPEK